MHFYYLLLLLCFCFFLSYFVVLAILPSDDKAVMSKILDELWVKVSVPKRKKRKRELCSYCNFHLGLDHRFRYVSLQNESVCVIFSVSTL